MPSTRQKIGCWLHERWRTELALLLPAGVAAACRLDWKWLRNRHERLSPGSDGVAVCDWEESSFLTVARFFPRTGGKLFKHCLEEWPVRLAEDHPSERGAANPKVSVILPVGGRDRMFQFLCVLAAFFGQTVPDIEIIAVEHAPAPDFQEICPSSVTYLFIPRNTDREFNKSLAMNAAVSAAKAPHVLLHDADVVPPARYVETILEKLENGWDAVRPIRFAFHLDRPSSEAFFKDKGRAFPENVAEIQANNPGLSTAIRRDIYEKIGGHDERFEGWGGEDLEFLDRLATTRLFKGGYAPAVHLWHPPAARKANDDRNNELMNRLRHTPVDQRVGMLAAPLRDGHGS